MVKGPLVIGISGASCSGKTSVAGELRAILRRPAALLSLDAYYRDLSDLDPEKREAMNFDHPDALDFPLLSQHVRDICEGKAVKTPVYDFRTHCRTRETELVDPAEVLIVEGIFALFHDDMKQQYGLTVFIDLDDEEALGRRTERDIRERGRKRESIVRQYSATVKPMFERYVLGTRDCADMVLDGRKPVEESALIVSEEVERKLRQRGS